MNNLGYTKHLFILPFDHRSSFIKNLLDINNRKPNEEETQKIIEAKRLIYEAFKDAVSIKIPKEEAAILVDEEFGSYILTDARSNGYITIITTEKSGQEEFDLEYGENFGEHIKAYNPVFVKVLVRYNPQGDKDLNQRQLEKLKTVSDYCHKNNYKFLIEPLVLPTQVQLQNSNNDKKRFDTNIRPLLTVQMIQEFQQKNVEADIWKIEGMENPENYRQVIEQARKDGRDNVSIVILGRGENPEHVERWIKNAAGVEGVIGFAIGRTIFMDTLVLYGNNQLSRDDAVKQISENYQHFYDIFVNSK